MEDVEYEYVHMFAAEGLLHNDQAVVQLNQRMQATADTTAATRQNFILDNSTPHGDVIVSDSSALKPNVVGWVTLHVTEALKSGIHEWTMKIENQGETSDGSGLMLGIVPKNFSRYDSFISQGNGWCISRAGKFYGHWRRVDNNTSVSSLVFGTGDRVQFELDIEAARMTVRVGDRFVIGELNNLSGEIFPAISLHYRHQHVRFDYHKVRERHAKKKSWIERNVLPSAALFLPLTAQHAMKIPLDVAVLSRREEFVQYQSAGEALMLARLSIALKAFSALQRYVQSGLIKLHDYLPSTIDMKELQKQLRKRNQQPQGPTHQHHSFASNCSSLVFCSLLSKLTYEKDTTEIVTSGLDALLELMYSMEFPGLHEAEETMGLASGTVSYARDELLRVCQERNMDPALQKRYMELLLLLLCQRGYLRDILRLVRFLFNGVDDFMSERLRLWLKQCLQRIAPMCPLSLVYHHEHRFVLPTDAEGAKMEYSHILSMACNSDFIFFHHGGELCRLRHTASVSCVCASTCNPRSLLTACAFSSMIVLNGYVLVHSSKCYDEQVALVQYSTDLVQMRTITISECAPLNSPKCKIFSDSRYLYVFEEDDVGTPLVNCLASDAATCTAQAHITMCDAHSFAPVLQHQLEWIVQADSRNVLQISKELTLDFGNPSTVIRTPSGHVTVEFWLLLLGKDETKTLYQHGDKALTGEVFVETHVAEGVLSIRGGSRHDGRGVKVCAVSAPVTPTATPQWMHVALLFDGQWKLLLNAEIVGCAKTTTPQPSIEKPRGKWTVGNGCTANMAELRVWSGARTNREILRDFRRRLIGSEPGLLLYCPMAEVSGHMICDYSPSRQHGWLTKGSNVVRNVTSRLPVIGEVQKCRLHSSAIFAEFKDLNFITNGHQIAIASPDTPEDTLSAVSKGGVSVATFTRRDGNFALDDVSFVGRQFNGPLCCDGYQVWVQAVDSRFLMIPIRALHGDHTMQIGSAGQQILHTCEEICVNSGSDNRSVVIMPFGLDISPDTFKELLVSIKEHYRPIQGTTSRKVHNVKDDDSMQLITSYLQILKYHIKAIVALNIHPSVVDLHIDLPNTSPLKLPFTETTIGAQLLNLLSAILVDATEDKEFETIKEVAKEVISCSIAVFIPSITHRVSLIATLLEKTGEHPVEWILLQGLLANFSSIDTLVHLENSRQVGMPTLLDLGVMALKHVKKYKCSNAAAIKALSNIQLLLFSSADPHFHACQIPLKSLFFAGGGDQVNHAVDYQSYFEVLVDVTSFVLSKLTPKTTEVALFMEGVFHNAIAVIPCIVDASTCEAFLSILCPLYEQLKIDPTGQFGDISVALLQSMSWVAAFIAAAKPIRSTTASNDDPVEVEVPNFILNYDYGENVAPTLNAQVLKQLTGRQALDSAGGEVVDQLMVDFISTVIGLWRPQSMEDLFTITRVNTAARSVRHKVAEFKGTENFNKIAAEFQVKARFLRQFRKQRDFQMILGSFIQPRKIFATMSPKAKWKALYRKFKWCGCVSVTPSTEEDLVLIVNSVSDFVFGIQDVEQLRKHFSGISQAAQLRIKGLSFVNDTTAQCNPEVRLELCNMYVRGACAKNQHYLDEVEGCGSVLASEIQRYTYSILDRIVRQLSTQSAATALLAVDVLSMKWKSQDFGFLNNAGIVEFLFSFCSIFDSTGAQKPESDRERERRESHRSQEQIEQKKEEGSKWTSAEELCASSWTALKALLLQCASGITEKTELVDFLGCLHFTTKFLMEVNKQLNYCNENLLGVDVSQADRVCDYIASILSLLATFLSCFPAESVPPFSRCRESLASIVDSLMRYVLHPLPVRRHHYSIISLKLLSLLLQRITPSVLGDSTSGGEVPAVIEFLLSVASGHSSMAVEPVTGPVANCAIQVLRELFLGNTHWSMVIVQWIKSLPPLAQVSQLQKLQSSPDEVFRFIIALLVITPRFAERPVVGGVYINETEADVPRKEHVIVLDAAPSGLATVIRSNLQHMNDELEIGLDALITAQDDAPLARTELCLSLVPFLAACVDDICNNWLALSSHLVLSAIVAFSIRAVKLFCADNSCCLEFLQKGTIRKVHHAIATKLCVSPLPLEYLREQVIVPLSVFMKDSKNPASSSAMPSISGLARLDHNTHDEDLNTRTRSLLDGQPAPDTRRKLTDDLVAQLLLPNPSAYVQLTPKAQAQERLCLGVKGATVEVLIYLKDCFRCSVANRHPIPSCWDKPQLSCSLVSAKSACGTFEYRMSVTDEAIQFELKGSKGGSSAVVSAPLHIKDYNRWMYLVGVFDGNLHLYRDGDVIATKSDPAIELASSEVGSLTMGGPAAEKQESDTYVIYGGVRLWGEAMEKHFVKSIADIIATEDALPAVSVGNLAFLCCRFQEGTGTTVTSEDGSFVGQCCGTRWITMELPNLAAELDVRSVDDIPRDVSGPEVSIPRKEWNLQMGTLDLSNVALMGIQCFVSITSLYGRLAVLKAIQLASGPYFPLLWPDHDPTTTIQRICDIHNSQTNIPALFANLVRYTSKPQVDLNVMKQLLDMVQQYVCVCVNPLSVFDKLVQKSLSLLSNSSDVFPIEIPYSPYPSEPVTYPLFVTGGGVFTLCFDSARCMDYLYIFADRTQKVHIAKYPDAQGLWQELELTHNMWFFVKPTSSSRTNSARFFVKMKSKKFTVGVNFLSMLMDAAAKDHPNFLPLVLNQPTLALLAATIHAETSPERRLQVIRLLTKFLLLWGQNPTVQAADCSPLFFPLEKILLYGTSQLKKEQQQGVIYNSPGQCYSRITQNIAELLVAVIQCDTAFAGTDYGREKLVCNKLVDQLYIEASENSLQLENSTSPLEPIVPLRITTTGLGPTFRERGKGYWYCSCDRGWHSVRGSVGVSRGRWYFEVRLPNSSSVICVGVITSSYRGSELAQLGVSSSLGQCQHSWCFDGSRLCRWYNGVRNDFSHRSKWKAGDCVGLLLDLEEGSLSCTHNGKLLGVAYENLTSARTHVRHTYYPAVSFNPNGSLINFGGAPFEQDIPPGYLAFDRSFLDASLVYPIPHLMALIDSAKALTTGQPLPSFFTSLLEERFISAQGRTGTEEAAFALVDGKPVVEKNAIRSGAFLTTVKVNITVSSGRWYYEVLLQNDGIMQVGWADPTFVPDSNRSKGIGDDQHSWSIDGCRMMARHNKQQRGIGRHPWKEGDIVGCLLDCEAGTMSFTINGQLLREVHDSITSGGFIFNDVNCSAGMSPCVSLDPDTALTVVCAREEQIFRPPEYASIGVLNPIVTVLTARTPQQVNEKDTNNHPLQSSFRFDRSLVRVVCGILDSSNMSSTWHAFTNAHFSTIASSLEGSPFPLKIDTLRQRLLLLYRYATLVEYVLPFIPLLSRDYGVFSEGLLMKALSTTKDVVFSFVGLERLNHCVRLSNGSGEPVKLNINRRKAMSRNESVSTSIFGQIFALIGEKPPSMFCTSKRLWSVVFTGEGADDVGGPYRESIAEICSEAMSDTLPLFVPSPNQTGNIGECRDRFVLAPSSIDPAEANTTNLMYYFLGKVMGGCLRSGEPLALYLPSKVWKVLVGDECTVEDLELIDYSAAKALEYLASCENSPEEEFAGIYDGGFVTTESSGRECELFQNSANIKVTSKNVAIYVQMVRRHRLVQEDWVALDALRRGFHKVVPLHSLAMMHPDELERIVCGRPDFDVEDLRASVRYDQLTPQDSRVEFLWKVLKEFTQNERALFMRFVSGRTRLPPSVRLRLMPSPVTDGTDDQHLPGASTCFFWLSLPNYSCPEILKEKLSYAIQHCVDIDADFRVRDTDEEAPPILGHTEEEEEGEFEDYSHLL